jgi:Tfp pilus assembly protein FimT
MTPKQTTSLAPSAKPLPASRRAFTLTEMLVVIGIIILVALSAVPSFNYLTGSRSLEAAQNAVAAALSRARQQALYEGKPTGLAIWLDATTGRYTLGLVQFDTTPASTPNIDLVPDQDFQTLQPGIGAQGLLSSTSYTGTATPPGPAVVFFDQKGQLGVMSYAIIKKSNGSATIVNQLYTRLGLTADMSAVSSQIALILYDRKGYDAKNNVVADENTYLNENGLYLVINRYNGTLLSNQQ